MKQNSIFAYVKRNNNNSEGVDGNEQCSVMVTRDHNMNGSENGEISSEPTLMKQTEQMVNPSWLQQSVTKCVVCVYFKCVLY